VAALVGLADFYRWEFEYGHNLDPHAAIKVPGLAYQPPLIGPKKLLNFTAHSWPGAGGWIAMGVFAAVAILAVLELRRAHIQRSDRPLNRADPAGSVVAAARASTTSPKHTAV
jgi:hypothetical protein